MHNIEEPWRMFLYEEDDGRQTLVVVWPDLNEADILTRPDEYTTWSAPKKAKEVWTL